MFLRTERATFRAASRVSSSSSSSCGLFLFLKRTWCCPRASFKRAKALDSNTWQRWHVIRVTAVMLWRSQRWTLNHIKWAPCCRPGAADVLMTSDLWRHEITVKEPSDTITWTLVEGVMNMWRSWTSGLFHSLRTLGQNSTLHYITIPSLMTILWPVCWSFGIHLKIWRVFSGLITLGNAGWGRRWFFIMIPPLQVFLESNASSTRSNKPHTFEQWLFNLNIQTKRPWTHLIIILLCSWSFRIRL